MSIVNNSHPISDAVISLFRYSVGLMEKAEELRNETNREDGTWGQAIGSRGLYIAQVVASIVALPIFLLAAIFAPALALCIEGKEDAWKALDVIGRIELFHLSVIPTALIAAFAPHSAMWNSPAKEVSGCVIS
jgi:hypothetical protein